MTIKGKIITAFFGTAAILLTGFLIRQKYLLDKSDFKLKKFKLKNYSANDATIQLVYTIQNNTDVNFSIRGYKLELYLNDSLVASPKSDEKIPLPAHRDATVALDINFNPSQVKDLGLNLIMGTNFIKTTRIGIKGKFKMGVFSDTITTGFVPVNYSTTLAELMK